MSGPHARMDLVSFHVVATAGCSNSFPVVVEHTGNFLKNYRQ